MSTENCIFEIAENNRRMAMVGDAMARMPRALSPVAVLISDRQYAYDFANANYPKVVGGIYTASIGIKSTVTMRRYHELRPDAQLD